MKSMISLVGGLCAILPCSAQDPGATAQLPKMVAGEDLLVAIHTHPDDPDAGAYGTWAAGPDYKVSFDDGFTFYPLLGEQAPRNLPLRWRTHKISIGDRTLVDATTRATPSATDWRYELRYPGVTEAYDVLRSGVEQTFVLHRPTGTGDVIVEGVIDTPLHSDVRAGSQQTLSFADDNGREVVRYGNALAFDAANRRIPMDTSFDGSRVRLTLPAEWLAHASYPVTIDPLTSTSSLISGNATAMAVSYPNIAYDSFHDQLMIAYSRASSATDWDTYVRLRNGDLTSISHTYTDLSAIASTRHNSVAYVRGANRWIVAVGVQSAFGSNIRIYFHTGGDTGTNTGTTLSIPKAVGFQDQVPSVAGRNTLTASKNGYLVFRRDVGMLGAPNTGRSLVIGMLIDAQAKTAGSLVSLHTDPGVTNYDAEWPMITPAVAGTDSWIVVWQEYNHDILGDDWDIRAQRVREDGTLAGMAFLAALKNSLEHHLNPVVAGGKGRYMVSFLTRDNNLASPPLVGKEVQVQRFDWPEGASAPTTKGPIRTVAGAAFSVFVGSYTSRTLAYDNNTRSHWSVLWQNITDDIKVSRLGYTGLTVEQADVFFDGPGVGAGTPALCYNSSSYEFPIVYGEDSGFYLLRGTRLRYQSAVNNHLGSPCGAAISGENAGPRDEPFAGSEFFALECNGASNAATVLFAGVAQASLPIPGSCMLRIDPTGMVPVATGSSDAGGLFSTPIPLQDQFVDVSLYWQYFQLDNSGRLRATEGLRTVIK